MVQRELLYTGVTRAREELYVICEPESFTKGIVGQRIKGNTIEEKSAFFKGKLESGEESIINKMLADGN
jgi:superfamily I DNA/RNA helicase